MHEQIELGRSDRASGVSRFRWARSALVPHFAASTVLVFAAALSACGDASKPDVMQETPSATPAPGPNSAPATTPPPAPADSQSSPAPSGAGTNEGEGTLPLPVAPPSMTGGNAAPPAAGSNGNAPEQMPAPMAMEPPAEPMQPAQPAAFQPCPTDGSACKIMPLGDSITFGLQSSTGGGYRVELFRKTLADRHPITFVGRQATGPNMLDGQVFPRNNEGYSGATIATGGNQLANRVDAAFAANPPDIVLLHIGTNNLYQGLGQGVTDQLGALIDQIISDAPDALVVVAQITPLGSATNGVQAYNAAIPAIVQQRVDAGKHLLLVNMSSAFAAANTNVSALLADGVHPNDQGYAIMAQTWYDAIESVLP
jgi:lysophospholipase L1-like esterase